MMMLGLPIEIPGGAAAGLAAMRSLEHHSCGRRATDDCADHDPLTFTLVRRYGGPFAPGLGAIPSLKCRVVMRPARAWSLTAVM